MADDDEPLPTFADLETLEKLGQGGMCEVYRVRDGERELAVKVLTDSQKGAVERFAAEARLLQSLDHPNVLKVHVLHDEDSPPWIEMELLAGKDLEETRRSEGPIAPERAARWFADLASGLAEVHAKGVRHRDIKPANIMLGHDGIPRLIDFGIARQTNTAHVTRQGFVVGTASYLPPEIFFDDNSRAIQDSEVADVYALGQTLCEVLTGESVHPRGQAGGDAAILVRIMKDKVERLHLDPRDWLSACPAGLADIVVSATKQEPEDRLATAHELEAALRRWLESRQLAEAAPVTTLKAGELPAPPTPAPAERREELAATVDLPEPPSHTSTPAPAARPSATPAPVARVATGAAGAAGFMGIGAVGVGSLAVALGVVGALWYWAPKVPTVEAQRVLAAQVNDLASCQAGSDLVVRITAADGRVAAAKVSGSVDGKAWACVESVLEDGAWPEGRWSLTAPLSRP